jgi:Icc-related predicted phosphoesterase
VNFLAKLNFKHKVIIAGHKEMTFDTERYQSNLRKIFHNNFPEYDGELYKSELQSLDGVYYLEHEPVEIEGIRIFGSPYQPMFFDCAFGREEPELKEIWAKVEDKIDILVSHCPPFGVMDQYKGTNTGCKALLDKVNQLKPKYHVFGHNRDCHGKDERDGTTFISCCRFDSKFKPVNDPILI